MPKKRQSGRHYRPRPSFEPATPRLDQDAAPERGVNDLLATLRRTSLSPAIAAAHIVSQVNLATTPSLPPTLRHILQIPDTPAPQPRRPARFDSRRWHAGPPPPRSWQVPEPFRPSSHYDQVLTENTPTEWGPLPGSAFPAPGSLVDRLLIKLALSWDWQREYNWFNLPLLPSHLRAGLIHHLSLGRNGQGGLAVQDLRSILLPPTDLPSPIESTTYNSAASNHDLFCLDLSGSVGCSISMKELSDFLFPHPVASIATLNHATSDSLPDTWDASPPLPALGPGILPNLTHLSLAVHANQLPTGPVWRHLLALAPRLSSLTHLSLAGWPEPSLSTNARIRLGGAGAVSAASHLAAGPQSAPPLDDDWAEAVRIIRRLSRALHRLQYLDLSGCAAWAPTLIRSSDAGFVVDWAGDWASISLIRLGPCHGHLAAIPWAVERHIAAQRASKDRPIRVEADIDDDQRTTFSHNISI